MEPRQLVVFECDHLRPVVRDDLGHWRHVGQEGRLAGRCHSHGYRIDVTPSDPEALRHNVGTAVRDVAVDPNGAGVLILDLLHGWYTAELRELTMFIDEDADAKVAELDRVAAARCETLGVTPQEWAKQFPQ